MDYNTAEDRSADRLLRRNQAWTIYNSYLSSDSLYDIGNTSISSIAISDD